MKQALGLVEIEGLTTAVVVADTMAKAANIQILELENTKGLGYMTIKIAGDVGAVNAAVAAGKQIGMMNQKLISWKVIPRPSDYVEQTFCQSGPPEPTSPSDQIQQETAKQEVKGKEEPVKAEAGPKAEAEPEPVPEIETDVKPESAASEPEKSDEEKSKTAVKEPGTKKRKK